MARLSKTKITEQKTYVLISFKTLVWNISYSKNNSAMSHKCAPVFTLNAGYSCQGTAVAQWLRCCAINRKVAGSIPDGVIGNCSLT